MSVIFVVLPLALLVVAAAVWAFVWATKRGQFDDLDTPAAIAAIDAAAERGEGVSEAAMLLGVDFER